MYQALIADDEILECYGMERIIHMNFPQDIELLPSVHDGISLLNVIREHRVDFLFLDINMPGINGLDALEMLRPKNKNMIVILVTAYGQFSYAQRAISLQVAEYVLKPVERNTLIEVIRKHLPEAEEYRISSSLASHQQYMETELYDAAKNSIVMNLLMEECNIGRLHTDLKRIGVDDNSVLAISFRINGTYSLSQISDLLIAEYNKAVPTVGYVDRFMIHLCLFPERETDELTYDTWIKMLTDLVKKALGEKISADLSAGISHWKQTTGQILEAIRESSVALHRAKTGKIVFYREETISQFSKQYQKFRKEFLKLVLEHRVNDGKEQLEQFIQENMSETSLSTWQACCEDLLHHVKNERLKSGLGIYVKEVPFPDDKQKTVAALWQKIDALYQEDEPKECSSQKYIQQALSIMQTRYMDAISLDVLAEKIGITSFYLSRLFKQELNQTFLDVLMIIRINKALNFLYQGLPVQEISLKVGYPNTNYFYKVFKKNTGLTVGEMKGFITKINIDVAE